MPPRPLGGGLFMKKHGRNAFVGVVSRKKHQVTRCKDHLDKHPLLKIKLVELSVRTVIFEH